MSMNATWIPKQQTLAEFCFIDVGFFGNSKYWKTEIKTCENDRTPSWNPSNRSGRMVGKWRENPPNDWSFNKIFVCVPSCRQHCCDDWYAAVDFQFWSSCRRFGLIPYWWDETDHWRGNCLRRRHRRTRPTTPFASDWNAPKLCWTWWFVSISLALVKQPPSRRECRPPLLWGWALKINDDHD